MTRAEKIKQQRDAATEKGYLRIAADTEKRYGIPSGMLAGLLEQESDHFDPRVISGERLSPAGAIGIAQFMPATAKDEGVNPLNVPEAIDGAGKYLASLQKQTNSWSGALTSYNWGIGNYKKWIAGRKKSIPKEARDYAGAVIKRAQNFGSLTPDDVPNLIPKQAQQTDALVQTPSGPIGVSSNTVQAGPVVAEQTQALVPQQTVQNFALSNPQTNAVVNTPQGPLRVLPENEEEKSLIDELTGSGEQGMLAAVPELLEARDLIRSAPLVAGRGDTLDSILGDLIDKV